MTVSRLNEIGEAVVVLTLDQEPSVEVLEAVRKAVGCSQMHLAKM